MSTEFRIDPFRRRNVMKTGSVKAWANTFNLELCYPVMTQLLMHLEQYGKIGSVTRASLEGPGLKS
jgi:hypothetical protein